MTELMNAVLLTGHGGPEKLVYTQVQKPTPKPTEVLIKVGACSVNNTDLNTRTGWYTAEQEFQEVLEDRALTEVESSTTWGGVVIEFPRIQGADIIGEVVAVGHPVNSSLLQQRVMIDPWVRDPNGGDDRYVGSELNGGFAEYAVMPATNVYPIHSPLSDVELACFPCSYSTAENMLVKGRVTGEDTVMIMGASGGVGSALIQLCKLRGAKVIAIASPSKHEFVREMGADWIYERGPNLLESLSNHQITIYLDTVGGDYFPPLLKQLQVSGRYISCGAIAGPMVPFDLRDLIYKDLELIGATRMETSVFQNLVNYINENRLKPVLSKTFPLAEIKAAQEYFQRKSFCGKVAIAITST